MSDLLSLPIDPEMLRSGNIRVSPVNGDNMEPTLRGSWDYVVCMPVPTYTGEGLYLLDHGGYGIAQVYRVDSDLRGGLRLISDNKVYPTQSVTLAQFESQVLAKVVADLKVRDERALRSLADTRS